MYMDFEKAFDKVPHRRLISKLYSYRINKKTITWISDFLIKKRFTVVVYETETDRTARVYITIECE